MWVQMAGQIGPRPTAAAKAAKDGVRQRVATSGGARCVVLERQVLDADGADATPAASLACVLAHGADVLGDDLFSLAHRLAKALPPGVRFVLPEAGREVRRAKLKHKPAIPEQPWQRAPRRWFSSAGDVDDAVDRFARAASAAADGAALVVGGFSQGAVVAAAAAGRLAPAGVVLLAPPAFDDAWIAPPAGARALVAVGASDDVAPRRHGERLATLLANGGCDAELVVHGGGHEVTLAVVDDVAAFLRRALPP